MSTNLPYLSDRPLQCRAIAAAVLGHGNSSHEIVAVQETYEVEALARNEVDVLIPETSMSMEQEANQVRMICKRLPRQKKHERKT